MGEILLRKHIPAAGPTLLAHQNKPDGYMCVSCAWAKPAKTRPLEFCENGAKATAWEVTHREHADPRHWSAGLQHGLSSWPIVRHHQPPVLEIMTVAGGGDWMEGIKENRGRAIPVHEDEVGKRAYAIWEGEGRPDGRHEDHWIEAKHEIKRESGEIVGGDFPNMDALREAAREHTDAFLIATHLEDRDQRESSPGTEQP